MQQKHDPRQGLPQPSPYVAAPAQVHIGDWVSYRGYAVKVWSILNLTVVLHPDQQQGLFYILKGEGMHKHIHFVVPAADVDQPQTFAA